MVVHFFLVSWGLGGGYFSASRSSIFKCVTFCGRGKRRKGVLILYFSALEKVGNKTIFLYSLVYVQSWF